MIDVTNKYIFFVLIELIPGHQRSSKSSEHWYFF